MRSAAVGGIAAAWTLRSTNRRAAAAPGGRTVAVFGAGPAGLTAAHELAERGFAVTVYERLGAAGGKCRSIFSDQALPSEHGFRSFFGFYHNLPDTLRRIPFRGNRNGVHDIALGAQLSGFETDGAHIRAATVTDSAGARHSVEADYYVSAIPLDKAPAVFSDGVLAADPRLESISRLQSAWMVGIQFFLRRRADLAAGHVAYVDSPWGLTSISEAQFWRTPLNGYGDGGVADVLSAIISEWEEPGVFDRKTAAQCSPAEIAAETWEQLTAHVNKVGDEPLTDDMLHSWMIDPALRDPGTPDVSYDDAIFIQNPGSWADRPDATTAIDNLFLAGDWIRTQMNVACMEGANEGGRLAANAVLHVSGSAAGRVPITPRFRMPLWEPLELADSALYHAGRPNAFDLIDRRYPVR
ncbi:FAD-dependent oxidoreductase [Nocardia sp. NPDC057663]|uniref:FAD-dependent oxidoreductase n=1 Tax=Nocardia sp. NPDC057663 TaxID=3346201 RepID=UPI00366B643C